MNRKAGFKLCDQTATESIQQLARYIKVMRAGILNEEQIDPTF
jgi:hypothetical protein